MAGRNGSGVFTVTNPDFVSGTAISSSEMDANFSDIATAITQSIAVDGQTTITANLPMNSKKLTGLVVGTATGDSVTYGQVWGGVGKKGADLTSAEPLVIGVDGNYFDVTGTATVATHTVAASRHYFTQFDGILTLTHHATTQDLPGEADITTAAGDIAEWQSTGANTVQCVNYTRADGTAIIGADLTAPGPIGSVTPSTGAFTTISGSTLTATGTITGAKGADIASATPTVLADGNYFDVTGTTTIAAFTVSAGVTFTVQFDGALTLTHHATNLDLPGEADITTAAGDVATFFATGANTVQCINYEKANGTAVVVASSSLTFGTRTATTSGTAFTFGSLPAGLTEILVFLDACSLSGTDSFLITIGDSGGLETSGYVGQSSVAGVAGVASTAGMPIYSASASQPTTCTMSMYLVEASSNTWQASHTGQRSDTTTTINGTSTKSLSGELTQISITRTGTDTFDAGNVTIAYR